MGFFGALFGRFFGALFGTGDAPPPPPPAVGNLYATSARVNGLRATAQWAGRYAATAQIVDRIDGAAP